MDVPLWYATVYVQCASMYSIQGEYTIWRVGGTDTAPPGLAVQYKNVDLSCLFSPAI